MNTEARKETIRRAQAGDQAAQLAVLEQLRPMLYRLASGLPGEIEELVQVGRVAVLEALPRVDPDVSFFAYWGQRLRGAMIDFLRREPGGSRGNGRLVVGSLEAPVADGDDADEPLRLAEVIGDTWPEFERIDDADEFAAFVRGLTDRQRTMLRLRYVDGLTGKQAAARLGISEFYVYHEMRAVRRLMRARAELMGRDVTGLTYGRNAMADRAA